MKPLPPEIFEQLKAAGRELEKKANGLPEPFVVLTSWDGMTLVVHMGLHAPKNNDQRALNFNIEGAVLGNLNDNEQAHCGEAIATLISGSGFICRKSYPGTWGITYYLKPDWAVWRSKVSRPP